MSANAGSATTQSVQVTPGLPSEDYFVTVTNDIGCTTEATVHIDVKPKTPVMVTGGDVLCIGETTTLSPNSGGIWTSSDASIAGVASDGTVTALSAGTATFTFLDSSTDCESDPTEPVTVNPTPTISVSGPDVICEGETTTLTPTTGGVWVSNNPSVATVTNGGVVTALDEGSVNFTFTDSSTGCPSDASVDVTVNTTFTTTYTGPTSICMGEQTFLTPTTGGTWMSNDETVATVSNIGVVTSVGPGTTDFVFTSDFSCVSGATAPLTVIPNNVISISGDTELCEDDIIQLTATHPNGTWSSSNNSIASISTTGVVTGIAFGTVTITYTHDPSTCGNDPTYDLTILEKPSVSLNGPADICAGEVSSVTTSATGGIWLSSDETVAIVSNSGAIVGLAGGTATFSYQAPNGCISDATIPIVVNPAVDVSIDFLGGLCLEDDSQLFANVSGGTADFTYSWSGPGGFISSEDTIDVPLSGLYNVLVTDAAGCSTDQTAFVYEAYEPFIFTLDTEVCEGEDVTLAINGSAGGTYQWSANAGSATTQSVTVTPPVPGDTYYVTITSPIGCTTVASAAIDVNPVPSITLTGGDEICVGGTTSLEPSTGGVWTSSNFSVASISNSGIVTGLAPGAVTFTYRDTSTGCYSEPSTSITINPNDNILINGDNDICIGIPKTLTASVLGGAWSSVNPAVATVDVNGNVTPVSAGSTDIIYSPPANMCYNVATKSVNVHNIPTVNINGPSTICEGEITYLVPSNGGVWVSDDPSVATVSSIGIVTAVGGGSANFTFTSDVGCVQTLATPITVIPEPVVSITGPSSICLDETTTLSPTTGGVWLSSNSVVASVNSSGLVIANAPGVAEFTFVEFTNGCTSNDVLSITVNSDPSITALADDELCIGETTSISPTTGGFWTTNNPTVATIANDGTITAIGAGAATFTFTDAVTGCDSDPSQALTVNGDPTINITGDTDLCVGDVSSILPSTGGTWGSSDVSIATITNSGDITAISAGTVRFTFTSTTTGCSSQPSDDFTVNNPSSATITAPSNLCIGETSVLTSTTNGTWESSNDAIMTVNNLGMVTAITPGIATITMNSTDYCVANPSIDIIIDPDPNPEFAGPTAVCLGETTTLSPATGGTWASADESIATVDNAGNVTSLLSGVVSFVFTDGTTGCSATTSTSLQVYDPPTTSIVGNDMICIGENTSMSPSTGGAWTSSDPSVAIIGANGLVTAITQGTVTFTYTEFSTGCVSEASDPVTILPKPVVSITGPTSLCIGVTSSLSPTTGGGWISSNESVATVTDDGIVTAVGQGVAQFTFVSNEGCASDETAPIVVYVTPTVTIDGPSDLCIGDVAQALPATGGSWTTSDAAVATIDDNGVITTIAAGTANFTFTDTSTGCVSAASESITVNTVPTTGLIGPDSICIGGTTNFTPTVGGVWSSVDPGIATIENNGAVTGVSVGSTRFIFTELASGCVADTTEAITVISESSPVFTGPTEICVGDTTYITPNTGGTWESTDEAVATINDNGRIIGVGQGTAQFRFTNGATGCLSEYSANVIVNGLATVFVNGDDIICTGSTTNLSPSSGGTWVSLNPGIASVDATGLVTGISDGTANFIFTDATTSCSSDGSLQVTVEEPTNIVVSGGGDVCIGYTVALTPSSGGVWTSNNEGIASVTSSGVVTGRAPGKVTFTFTSSSTGCVNGATSDTVTVMKCNNHDFNVAVVGESISGNLSTNDNYPGATTYSNSPQLITKPNASLVSFNVNGDGTYTFEANKAGNYRYNVAICQDPIFAGCPSSVIEFTVIENQYSTGNPVTNIDLATTFEAGTANKSASAMDMVSINTNLNDKCVYTLGCDMDWTSAWIETAASNGSAVIQPGGIIEYTPNAGFIGYDTIYYGMCADGYSLCNTSMQIVTVNHETATNSTVASDDFTFAMRGGSFALNVLGNDSDPEGDALTVTAQGSLMSPIVTAAGEYYIDATGNVNFTANDAFSGHTEIVYEVCDDNADQTCVQATLHVLIFDDISVTLRVYLEGALMQNGGATSAAGLPLMRDDLRVSPFTGENYIPLQDPYTIAADPFVPIHNNFNKLGPGLMAVNQEITDSLAVFGVTGDNAIVDWVHVELRSKDNMAIPIATRSGLLQRDGDVVDVDGVSNLRFNGVNVDSFYVVVKHRLHLGVMSEKVSQGDMVDFTSMSYPVYNFGLKESVDYTGLSQNNNVAYGYSALWAGDFDANGKVKFTNPFDDQNILFFGVLFSSPDFLINYNQAHGYFTGDYNMNSKIKYTNPNDDTNFLFSQMLLYPPNTSFLSNFNSLIEQVPEDE